MCGQHPLTFYNALIDNTCATNIQANISAPVILFVFLFYEIMFDVWVTELYRGNGWNFPLKKALNFAAHDNGCYKNVIVFKTKTKCFISNFFF
jgi:hypothetical protein